ncbi:MAG: hypothetical protein JXR03_21570, partial [Cyclobacteriaceae bacterium]
TTETAGDNCENGGIKIDSGVDSNNDGTLDDDEITATAYICNGIDGSNTLTKLTTESAGTNCENGGIKIDSGVDSNNNGILDDDEITATAYTCNGLDGKVSLVNIADEAGGANCENGGVKIDSGVDDNGDGTLDTDEVDITRYVCNGIDGGFDEQIRLRIETPLDNTANNDWFTNSTTYVFGGAGLFAFNKNNFVGVDSVVLASNPSNFTSGVRAYVDLFDATNNSSVSNSEISRIADYPDDTYIFSENIFGSLPETSIDLGVRVRTETSGTSASVGRPYLILYRSN